MKEIEDWLKKIAAEVNAKLPGGTTLRKLLVLVLSLVAATLAYRWVRDNVSKLLGV